MSEQNNQINLEQEFSLNKNQGNCYDFGGNDEYLEASLEEEKDNNSQFISRKTGRSIDRNKEEENNVTEEQKVIYSKVNEEIKKGEGILNASQDRDLIFRQPSLALDNHFDSQVTCQMFQLKQKKQKKWKKQTKNQNQQKNKHQTIKDPEEKMNFFIYSAIDQQNQKYDPYDDGTEFEKKEFTDYFEVGEKTEELFFENKDENCLEEEIIENSFKMSICYNAKGQEYESGIMSNNNGNNIHDEEGLLSSMNITNN